ncbi:hypothetical protein H2248_008067 [Termitomyces sp. 'cryptogamus']|nr:hypothetical protein H2248_008067 [Termitomyces sp. 'cryptogamus']
MAVLLLDLLQELISRVLCFLDLPELAILQRTHSGFRQLIQTSQGFQYRFAASLAGVKSNEHSTHTASERLAPLMSREAGWRYMNVDFRKSIPNVKSPGISKLVDGIFFMYNLSKRSIHYCRLPSGPSDNVFLGNNQCRQSADGHWSVSS